MSDLRSLGPNLRSLGPKEDLRFGSGRAWEKRGWVGGAEGRWKEGETAAAAPSKAFAAKASRSAAGSSGRQLRSEGVAPVKARGSWGRKIAEPRNFEK